ncbi:MAG: HAMP domain-containing protein [Planctomycetota bacterium]|jgi:HAMP domain-containing protein
MLRRKLLLVLGSLIVLLVVSALSAILLLHDVLGDLTSACNAAVTGAAQTRLAEQSISGVEAQLQQLQREPGSPPDAALAAVTALGEHIDMLVTSELLPEEAQASSARLREQVPELDRHLAAFAGADDRGARDAALIPALGAAAILRSDIAELNRVTFEQSAQEHQALLRKFRGAAFVVGIGFLVLLNVSIIVVLRAAIMVLKPVNALVEASRRLGREEFDHRVAEDRTDEFGELAKAYNGLAEQLQSNEERKVETLQQVARTLNHELNNAISTIELQLTVVDRRQGDDKTLTQPLRHIHQTLGRMSDTIDALKRVRKIVLTDYLSGVKMLDLERSVAEDDPSGQASVRAGTERSSIHGAAD